AAVQALGQVADPRAKELIYRVVQQDDFKEDALLAMGLRATPEDLAFLHRAALNRDFITRKDYTLGVLTQDKETVLLAIAKAFETAASRRPAAESEGLRHKAEVIRGWADNYPSILDENDLKPVIRAAQPAPSSPQPLESDQQIISGLIKKWLEAWRRQDLDEYIRYYHPDFHYEGKDLSAYKAYKAQTARKQGRVEITAEDVSIKVEGETATVTFLQDYRSENHYDFGQKTLVLIKQGATWLIKQETWTKREK
ncbi:MAG: nuclear transport factor 2 family protein, partial [Pseudomonadota bacterium]